MFDSFVTLPEPVQLTTALHAVGGRSVREKAQKTVHPSILWEFITVVQLTNAYTRSPPNTPAIHPSAVPPILVGARTSFSKRWKSRRARFFFLSFFYPRLQAPRLKVRRFFGGGLLLSVKLLHVRCWIPGNKHLNETVTASVASSCSGSPCSPFSDFPPQPPCCCCCCLCCRWALEPPAWPHLKLPVQDSRFPRP